MNRNLISGLTATLLIATLGVASSTQANPKPVDQSAEETLEPHSSDEQSSEKVPSPVSAPESLETVKIGSQNPQPVSTAAAELAPSKATASSDQPTPPATDAIKIGERQSIAKTPEVATKSALPAVLQAPSESEVIAKVHAHTQAGQPVATLYIKNIPVLTFIGSTPVATEPAKAGTKELKPTDRLSLADVKSIAGDRASDLLETTAALTDEAAAHDDPVWRASAIAAKLNQLNRDGIDASKITVSWDQASSTPASPKYLIKLGDQVIATIDDLTIFANSTHNPEADALQATNRLRRLLGNASPLFGVSGKPGSQQVSLGPININVSGLASWYGPGFDGNMSASGEVFNQNALTAAHRTLPFGTRVLVTNLSNGMSVIVKINDRGPYAHNRIIDLSAGAARMLGLIQMGVAPVRLQIVKDDRQTIAGN